MPISIYLASLSPDWVSPPLLHAKPNHPAPKTPTWRFDFAKYPSCQLESGWNGISFWAATATRVHQSIVRQRSLSVIEDVSCLLLNSFLLSTLFFYFSPCWEHVRIYFFHLRPMNARLIRLLCCSRIHFLSAQWLSASYHSRFRRTKKVTSSNGGRRGRTLSASGLNHSKNRLHIIVKATEHRTNTWDRDPFS